MNILRPNDCIFSCFDNFHFLLWQYQQVKTANADDAMARSVYTEGVRKMAVSCFVDLCAALRMKYCSDEERYELKRVFAVPDMTFEEFHETVRCAVTKGLCADWLFRGSC